jgi:RNA polymerase sigma-70 factor (ECF subfamily)
MEAAEPRAVSGAVGVTVPCDAFVAFYDSAFADVYRYLSRAVLGNRALAEDLTQETFASVVAAVRNGRPEAQSLPWVIGVARHKLIDHYRSTAREQRRLALAWSTGVGRDDEQLAEFDDVDPDRVVELLRDLPPDQRLVLVLKYLDGFSVAQISVEIGRSEHATESLLARARRALARSHREAQS